MNSKELWQAARDAGAKIENPNNSGYFIDAKFSLGRGGKPVAAVVTVEENTDVLKEIGKVGELKEAESLAVRVSFLVSQKRGGAVILAVNVSPKFETPFTVQTVTDAIEAVTDAAHCFADAAMGLDK